MSNFDSKIYANAKKFVRDSVNSGLNKIFVSAGQQAGGNTVNENNFALACLRLICKDTRANIDPTKNTNEFSQMVKELKLNELGGMDLGFGKGTSNNLLYRLAIQRYSLQILSAEKFKSKNSLLNNLLSDDDFLKSLIEDRLNDPIVYDVITKQAFFKWHYKNFIQDLEYNNVIKKENPGDGSSVGWNNVNPNEGVSFFISQTGAPFNTGTPIVCCVIQEKINDLKKIRTEVNDNKQKYLSKAFDEMLAAFGKKKWAETGNGFSPVKVINHRKKKEDYNDFVFDIVDEEQGIVKLCFGVDYALLNTIKGISLPPKDFDTLTKIKTFVGKELGGVVYSSFKASEKEETTTLFLNKVKKASQILRQKNEALQNGPALFFDTVSNPQAYDKLKLDLETYESIDQDTSTEILKAQYSPSAVEMGDSLEGVYADLIYNYYIKNRIQFIQFSDPLGLSLARLKQDKATEDMNFYFKFNSGYPVLLAVGATRRDSKEEEPSFDEMKTQNKNNPFEFSELDNGKELPLYIEEIENAYAVLKKVDFNNIKVGTFTQKTGINGEFLFVTEFLLKEILASETSLAKEIQPLIDKENLRFENNVYDVIRYSDILERLSATNNSFGPLMLATINGLIIKLNYIVLADQKKGILNFSSANLQLGTEFYSSTDTFSDRDTVIVNNIGKFLEIVHHPPLQIKPTVPKQKSATTEDPDAGLVKPKHEGVLTSAKKKKEKVYDLDDYNSWVSTGGKKIFVTLAQVSGSPCYEDLAKLVSTGTIDQVFEFLLTKFPWDEILAKALLTNLRRMANLGGATDFADAVNACLKDGGIDDLLNSFARVLDVLQNFDKVINSNIPEIPTIPELPYLYVLDFQKFFREAILKAVQEVILAILGQILGVMINEILGDCQLDGSLDNLLNEKLKGSENKTSTGADEGPVNASIKSNLGLGADSNTNLNNVSIDIVAILRASRKDSLDNIFNGVLDLFPNLRIRFKASNSNPTVTIEDYLRDVTEVLSAIETKNLLNKVAGDKEYSKVRVYTTNYNNLALRTTFSSNKNISLLFSYLNQFIDQDLINQEIVTANVIIPDPCYVNFGALGTEDIELLRELLGTDEANDYIANSQNLFSDQINSICSRLSNGVFDFANDLQNLNLISDSSKKALQGAVDSSFDYLVSLQNSTRFAALQSSKSINDYINYVYYGTEDQAFADDPKAAQAYYSGLGGTPVSSNPLEDIQIVISKIFDENIGVPDPPFNKNLTQEELLNYFVKQLNLLGPSNNSLGPIYMPINNGTQPFSLVDLTTYYDGKTPGWEIVGSSITTNFYAGLYYSDITKYGSAQIITESEIQSKFTGKDSVFNLTQEISSIFINSTELKKKYMSQFDEVVAEGGKNTNKFIANLQKMKSIINSATEGN